MTGSSEADSGSRDGAVPGVGGAGYEASPVDDLVTERHSFRRDVQGLRAIAVALVIVFHSGLAPRGGFLGVDVFFVISGFVIGRLLLSEQSRTGRISLGRFYARRIRRLVPALATMLVFVAVASIVALGPVGPLREITRNTGIGAALYVANFAILRYQDVGYFDLGAANNPLLHTWTLGVEEQFYLVFPVFVLVLVVLGRSRPRRMVWIGFAVAAALSFALGAMLTGSVPVPVDLINPHGRFAFYASPTRAWEFLVGALVACVEPRVRRRAGPIPEAAVVVGIGAILGAAWFVTGTDATPGPTTLVPVLGTASVILGGAAGATVSQRLLGARPMVWIGDRSYGWYLWHWPFMVFARISFPLTSNWVILAVGVVALVPTMLSYRFIEQPIRHNASWLGWRVVPAGAAWGGLAALTLIAVVAWAPVPKAQAAELEAVTIPTVRSPDSCALFGSSDDPNAKYACTWRVPDARGQILVIGDSLAWAISDAMVTGSLRAGFDESLAFRPGCPFADVERLVADALTERNCRNFVDLSMALILKSRPNLVVLVSNQDAYVGEHGSVLRDPVTGRTGRTEASRAEIWTDGLTRTLRRLADRDIPTVVVATVPQLNPFDLQLCPAWRLWVDPLGCRRTISRSTIDEDQRAGRKATAAAVAAVSVSSRIVDFEDDLCSPTACSSYFRDRWTYRDQTHISTAGARLLIGRVVHEVIPFARP